MTLVVARRFGRGVVLMGDTMLTDANGVSRGLQPGQLKIVPISDRVTVAFAGSAGLALKLIRLARQDLLQGAPLGKVVSDLARATRDDECEFIVCAHQPEPMLVKLREGRTANGSDRYTIGDASPLKRLPTRLAHDPTNQLEPHVHFRASMIELFNDSGHVVAPGVGGFLVDRSCTSIGHQFMDHHASLTWDTIEVPQGITPEQAADRQSGKTMYNYNCIAPSRGDSAVIGFHLPQPRIGFLFAPLLQDEGTVLHGVDAEVTRAEVARLAAL